MTSGSNARTCTELLPQMRTAAETAARMALPTAFLHAARDAAGRLPRLWQCVVAHLAVICVKEKQTSVSAELRKNWSAPGSASATGCQFFDVRRVQACFQYAWHLPLPGSSQAWPQLPTQTRRGAPSLFSAAGRSSASRVYGDPLKTFSLKVTAKSENAGAVAAAAAKSRSMSASQLRAATSQGSHAYSCCRPSATMARRSALLVAPPSGLACAAWLIKRTRVMSHWSARYEWRPQARRSSS